jgi:hypothetical protein
MRVSPFHQWNGGPQRIAETHATSYIRAVNSF